nr:ribonuclease H-like domain-containing protein [Tanacetum cinerariifolium]
MVHKEASHQIILGVTNENHGIGTGLIAGETNGMGLSTKGFRRFDGQKKPATRDDKSHLKCEECGMNRHTKDQCFKIIGYPDWWTNGHKTVSNKGVEKDKPSTSPTANTRTGRIIERGTERDGLYMLMRTGRIIGRGTERHRLYYVNEVVQSSIMMLAHGTTEREAWLWHRRLGHPSSYRDKLDPCAEKCIFVGYGVNQKGYGCYSPNRHRLFTSMNCDFLKTQYYYSPQHSGQGEEQGDPLSWLSYTSAATIGNEIQNHSTTSTEALNINATPKHPVPDMISEVSSSQTNNLDNSPLPQPDNLDENNADDIQDSTSEILQEHEVEVPRKYVLSPRSNRGVPPKRYSPEKTTRGAKYPMANIAEGNLSNNAKAFAVRICSEEIPSSFEQALKSEKWKKAMDDEMKALKK